MKTYELVIEKLQPACGGKDPKEVKMLTVTTDNPLVYVQEHEAAGTPVVQTGSHPGETVITLDEGMRHVTYTFTEE